MSTDDTPLDSDATAASGDDALVSVRDLEKYYYEQDSLLDTILRRDPDAVKAVDGVSFDVKEGETLGLVGESGCGKSTTGETVLRLREATGGSVTFRGEDITQLDGSDLKDFRRDANIVFQDPFSSLDPRMTAGQSIAEPLNVHGLPKSDPTVDAAVDLTTEGVDSSDVTVSVADDVDRAVDPVDGTATVHLRVTRDDGGVHADATENVDVTVEERDGGTIAVDVAVDRGKRALRRERAAELMERVGLSADQLDRYPHEFSGGQRQRIGIARALALEPDFIVLDEPVSALDVSVQAQVLNLLDDLQEEFGLTYLFIAHDLSVVRHICDRVAVMYLGEIVEIGATDEIFEDPRHPYTRALLESVPRADVTEAGRDVDPLSGDVPSPRDPPSGCHFRTRCPVVIPPDDLDIEQEAFRAAMDVRDRLERGDLAAADVESADDWRTAYDGDPDALPAAAREAFADAFESLAGGDEDAAAARLRETFETVCERDNPALGDSTHPAACHRVD
ncbi:ABC transporter ATP-binding protein [Halocalculus aciditolerans]|uniref:ABC transporter domain-containing protein n=1 Tax=Halocalculus aciditolerans TaxID=1383812 RepID=A0A830F183_9EURY|nr:ABC transporter ATP-binding protein [Halocalculus aciditolerans]GGL51491.1 hypothetical protein GCM10009039_07180 [Halocalculus aciditolerans]